ncbi:hypothetical protein [Pseudomonas sp.]|uniref:hypothetical protein n=1 Tax=Pseudomonas sp. TaxID=306 RepID=UPI003262E3C6
MTKDKTVTMSRELAERLLAIQPIERDDPNGSGCNLCPECFGAGAWNWKAGKVVSIDPIDHYAGCALEELRALLAAPVVERQVIDLDAVDWETIQQAADDSNWMPNEYMRNDWVADVCNFLKYGRADISPPAPVAVVLPERKTELDQPQMLDSTFNYLDGQIDGWNACLDKVKELNAL